MNVLFVCTGNICRSPMAEALLRGCAQRSGLDLSVSSAGITFDDRPATHEANEAMAAVGLDISSHRSRMLDVAMIRGADLVIGMERLHVREAVVLEPKAFGRTFTLKELVRRGENVGPRTDEAVEAWLAHVSAGRRPIDQLGDSNADDVADPIGRPARVYAATGAELADLVSRLVQLMWGPVAAARAV